MFKKLLGAAVSAFAVGVLLAAPSSPAQAMQTCLDQDCQTLGECNSQCDTCNRPFLLLPGICELQ